MTLGCFNHASVGAAYLGANPMQHLLIVITALTCLSAAAAAQTAATTPQELTQSTVLTGAGIPGISPGIGAAAAIPQTLTISGPSAMAQNGGTGQYQVTMTGTDGSVTDVTSKVTWQILENQVATVSAGKVTPAGLPGQFTIRAAYGNLAGAKTATVAAAKTVNISPIMSLAQINSAVANAAAGSEIVFAAGTYRLGCAPQCGILAKSGLTYTGPIAGSTPASLVGTGGYPLLTVEGDTNPIVVQHLQFSGGGLYFNSSQSNFDFEYNEVEYLPFQDSLGHPYSNPGATDGIFENGSLTASDISYNSWHDLNPEILDAVNDVSNGGTAVAIGNFGKTGGLSHVTLDFNRFNKINEGIHIFGDVLDGRGVQINNNTYTNFHRIAIELQDNSFGELEIGNNLLMQPYKPSFQTFGISAALGGNSGYVNIHDNAVLTNNVAINPVCSGSGCHYGYGLEIWGTNTVGSHNLIQGAWGTSIGYACSHAMTLQNNSVCTGGGMNHIQDESSATNCGSGYITSGIILTNNALTTADSCTFQ